MLDAINKSINIDHNDIETLWRIYHINEDKQLLIATHKLKTFRTEFWTLIVNGIGDSAFVENAKKCYWVVLLLSMKTPPILAFMLFLETIIRVHTAFNSLLIFSLRQLSWAIFV